VNLFLYPLNHGIPVHKTNGPLFAAYPIICAASSLWAPPLGFPPQEGEEAPASKTLCGTSYELSR